MMRIVRTTTWWKSRYSLGDYSTVDDPEAQRCSRSSNTPTAILEVAPEESNQALASYRNLQKKAKEALFPKTDKEANRGPMGNAFVVTNPILPQEYFVPKGVDKLVLEMNSGVPHSLLDCPGPYTVKVATFTGHAVILDKKRQDAIDRGQMPKSYLEEAAKNAARADRSVAQEGLRSLRISRPQFEHRHDWLLFERGLKAARR